MRLLSRKNTYKMNCTAIKKPLCVASVAGVVAVAVAVAVAACSTGFNVLQKNRACQSYSTRIAQHTLVEKYSDVLAR